MRITNKQDAYLIRNAILYARSQWGTSKVFPGALNDPQELWDRAYSRTRRKDPSWKKDAA